MLVNYESWEVLWFIVPYLHNQFSLIRVFSSYLLSFHLIVLIICLVIYDTFYALKGQLVMVKKKKCSCSWTV